MKIIYFDCFCGVSGDMILGALVDAGLKPNELESELQKLKLTGYTIHTDEIVKNGFAGTKVSIETEEQHVHRHLGDIINIIDGSDLSDDIKAGSKRIFEMLAAAEAKVHNTSIDKIHFHEVGALDSIVDIVGSVIGIKKLGIDAVYSSRIHVGRGFVECQHGKIPVPAPATLELLEDVPLFSTGIDAELTTPTGAAILKTLSRRFGDTPNMKLERVGYGAGCRDMEIPNLLRVWIGESKDDGYEIDNINLVETNIDDMNPEFLDYVFERLADIGALDTYITPVFMKKNRPGIILSVLAPQDKLNDILSTIFTETTTLGVRIQRIERKKLTREILSVATRFGDLHVKVCKLRGIIKNIAPEFEDCKRIAIKEGVPLKDVYDEVKQAARDLLV